MLTKKGAATRARIIDAAAELVAANGAANTCLDDIRSATGTSKSQLFHYFPDGKAQLLFAVAEEQARRVLDDQLPLLDELTSWEAWQRWKELILRLYAPKIEYCPLAALTSQFPRNDPRIRELISGLFESWQASLAKGLATMRAGGLLRADADTDELATAVLVAVQGGVAMGQAIGSLDPLRTALDAAIGHVRTYALAESART
ncbi:TetR/AcrR family transcriptional regulator [Actinopolymorpha pittospori]|uniref:AcrR family transcriptional regulator n=1 Tax=Actinopolymorpha pittospori TaxID=648752 RepID=A0A927RE09_9ACTN|nr:TetR/AcrR family transcriptional regulator [Actinopolymorpha pittospori]MBE1613022.1 AcrR family transcriptional regulator [Actinopolymorpha pittospori]